MWRIFKYFWLFFFISNYCFCQKASNERQANLLLNKAYNDFDEGNPKVSVEFCKNILEYSLSSNNNTLTAEAYMVIGMNFDVFGDLKKSELFYKKALKFALESNNDRILGKIYQNLGMLYLYNEIDVKKALYYFEKHLTYIQKTKIQADIIESKLHIINCLIDLGQFDKASQIISQLKSQIISVNSYTLKSYYYATVGEYFFKSKNDFNNAETHFKKAHNYLDKLDKEAAKYNKCYLFENLSKLYFKNNKFNKAYQYLLLHDQIEDELYTFERKDRLKNDELSIELSEVNNQISKIEDLNKDYLKQIKNFNFFVSGLILILLLFLYMLYTVIRNHKKNKIINEILISTNFDLSVAKKKTEEATALKTQFLSTVSHELRTPLYGVIGMIEIIESENPNLTNNAYFKTLKFSSKHLLSLINDVLFVFKLQQEGGFDLQLEPVNLKKELEIVKTLLDVIAKQRNNLVILKIDSTVPEFIETDKTRLAQIVINLLSNSLKFTTNGTVTLSVNRLITNDNSLLKFKIIDTGIGIPPEFLEKVFEKFIQVERSVDDNLQGTGLGLTIVKKIVENFGGKIKIESLQNHGTTVNFTIPFKESKQTCGINSLVSSPIKKNISILVIDDNQINQIITHKMLINNHQNPKLANNGVEALEILATEAFDLILMDIHMPNLNGFETSKKIRELKIKTPIIAMTASDKDEILQNKDMIYMNDVLVKPFDYAELLILIDKYVS